MSASQRHPAHDLFDHWWVPGGIQTLVMNEYKKSPRIEVNVPLLSAFFESRNCTETSRLIEYLASEPGLCQIGSGTIDVGSLIGLSSEENPRNLQELYIGKMNPKIMPLAWLAYLARGFEEIPEPLRPVFDKFCGALVTMVNLPSTPVSFDELDELPALTKQRPRTLADMFGDLDAEAEEKLKKKN